MFFAPALTRHLPASARPPLPVRHLPAVVRRGCLTVVCVAALLVPLAARAQNPGDRDTTFTSALVGGTFYAFTLEELNNTEYAFIAGDTGLSLRELASTGETDTSFGLEDFGAPTQRIIYTAVQERVITPPYFFPKVLVGGLFGRNADQILAKQPGQNIKRFVPSDGALDPTFNPGAGADNFVTSILPLADGSMVVAGEFTLFNKIAHERIVKLDNSGAIVDNSLFSGKLAFDATVLSLAPQYAADGSGQNGQILVGGVFSNVNGQTHAKLARINADGSVDGAFNPVFGDRVRIVVSTTDGKILAGGDFETVNGHAVKHLVRLNFDGSVDTTFNALVTTMPAQIGAPVAVNTITPLGDGRYYIGGNFYAINGVSRHYLGRVLADGTVDDFDPGTILSNAVQQVAIDPVSSKVFVTQTRDKSINNVYPPSVFRLFGDPPGVTLTAKVPVATSTRKGKFKITRTNDDAASPVTVYLTRGGTATAGDYTLSPALVRSADINGQKGFLVTIPAGKQSQAIKVLETATARAGRTATLTIQPDQSGSNDYTVGSSSTATVTLE